MTPFTDTYISTVYYINYTRNTRAHLCVIINYFEHYYYLCTDAI